MNSSRKILITLTIMALLALFALPAFAAETSTTISITETQVNESYWVTNPPWRAVSEVSVDFQPGQVVVNGTITLRRGEPVSAAVTLTPSITNGRVTWTAVTVTRDGAAISEDLLNQINDHISSSWARYWRTHRQPGLVTAVEITDDAINVTLTSRR